MLTDRKRYNYMIYNPQKIPSTKPSSKYPQKNQNLQINNIIAYQTKKINQLQNMNKKIISNTTQQFQKFQKDILQVQTILKLKQQHNKQLDKLNQQLNLDKSTLIQALSQKQTIILQFNNKLKQLIIQRQNQKQPKKQFKNQFTHIKPSTTDYFTQTQKQIQHPQPQIICTKQQYNQLKQQLISKQSKYTQLSKITSNLQQQVYKLKQQLYLSTSQLNLLRQQFSTYKLLHQIDLAKNL